MIIVLASLFGVWLLVREPGHQKFLFLISVGLILSYLTALLASYPPLIDIPLNEHEALRTYPPFAYPFALQQYRDYDARIFYYSVILGWPEGIPIYSLPMSDDQSEFIHLQHYQAGLTLGIISLAGMSILVVILSMLDNRGHFPSLMFRSRSGIEIDSVRNNDIEKILILFWTVLLLILGALFVYWGSINIIYSIGASIVILLSAVAYKLTKQPDTYSDSTLGQRP